MAQSFAMGIKLPKLKYRLTAEMGGKQTLVSSSSPSLKLDKTDIHSEY